MYKYVLKRLLMLIPVIIGVTFIVFFILNLSPGDPAAIILGDQATAEALAMKREELGLNDPLLVRYGRYMFAMLQGDLGTSYKNNLSVWAQVMERFPNTAVLAIAGILVAILIGIPTGILSAKRQYSMIDNTAMLFSLIGVAMPNFWFGLLMVIIFALHLGWLPSQGMGEGFIPLIKSLILPAVTLGTGAAAMITRMTRSSMLEVIRQDYIDTARAKGVSDQKITTRHMLKNAMIPIITAVGLQFGTLLGGAMLTETVFSWPGLGRLMVDSIKSKDIPMVLGSVTVSYTHLPDAVGVHGGADWDAHGLLADAQVFQDDLLVLSYGPAVAAHSGHDKEGGPVFTENVDHGFYNFRQIRDAAASHRQSHLFASHTADVRDLRDFPPDGSGDIRHAVAGEFLRNPVHVGKPDAVQNVVVYSHVVPFLIGY